MTFKLLLLDLAKRSSAYKEVSSELLSRFLGGRGLGVRLFFDFIERDFFQRPDEAESPIFFLTGPLTGSMAPLSGRFHSVFHSPLSGTIADSSCGGRTGVFLKSNGIDGIIVKGRADTPLYVLVNEGEVRFEDALPLAGKTVAEKEDLLRERFGSDISTILIGPAGERGVLFANAISDRRFFGRGGLGYRMGEKNLLGIVVKKGKGGGVKPAYEDKFNFVVEEVKKWVHGNPITSQGLPEFGTSVLMNLINELRLLPHKNFKERHFARAEAISGEALKSKVVKRRACFGCMVACGRVTERGEGPEFETLWALGANLGIDDLDFIIEMNEFCNQNGMDTITLGGTIAAYIEAKGVAFGDKSLVERLIKSTAKKEGDGELIALGSKRMCEVLGKRELSMAVKGMEMPAYHPAGLSGMALSYGTSNRGGCHLRAYMIAPEVLGIPRLIDPKIKTGKAGLVIYLQNSHAVADSAIFCRFLSLAVTDDYLSRLVSAFTGFDLSTVEYQRIGERIYLLERLFNSLLGFKRTDDFLPERVSFDGYEEMLKEYYTARGFDENGVPLKEKLEGLGLKEVLAKVYD